jgi:hypothetical protein
MDKENNFSEKQPQQSEDPKIQLRRLLEANPNILSDLGIKQEKQAKSKPTVKAGTVITVPQEKPEEPQEIIKVISQRKAKQILEENGMKRTRIVSDEVKKTMLENLQKGREKLKQQREERKMEIEKEKEKISKQSNIEVKKEIKLEKEIKNQGPTIKYVVKPKIKREFKKLENPKKFIKEEDDSEDEVSSALPTDSESEISDTTLLRKIKRNIKTIKKVDKVIEETKKPEVVKPRYNLWYN